MRSWIHVGPILLLAACTPDVTVTPVTSDPVDNDPEIGIDPPLVAFGEALSDETLSRWVTVTNVGASLLDVEDVTLDGGPSFSLGSISSLPVALGNGESWAFEVRFQPLEDGIVEAEAIVHSDAKGAKQAAVPMSGVAAVPQLEITPDPLDFGEIEVPCLALRSVTFANRGREPLVLSEFALTGAGSELWFGFEPTQDVVLGLNQTHTMNLLYEPTETGVTLDAQIVVTSNDEEHPGTVAVGATTVQRETLEELFQSGSRPSVDVLFAVDQSCSMGDDAAIIAQSFGDFADLLSTVGTDWQLGIVTGDAPNCFQTGIVRPDQPDWEDRIQDALGEDPLVPTGDGLAWLTEAGLESTRDAIQLDGPGLCNEGFRRPGAELHLVMVSDERDQSSGWGTPGYWRTSYLPFYESYANGDLLRVHAVVDDVPGGFCNMSSPPFGPDEYDDLANHTGGEIIRVCAAWSGDFLNLAGAVGQGYGAFQLTAPDVDATTVRVFVDGAEWTTDWTYDAMDQTVQVDPALLPVETPVLISYRRQPQCNLAP